MKRFLFWLVVSCCIVGFTASDNPDFFTRVVHNFMVLRQAKMQEKVWLHTDRPSYHAGDTIRFRAFLVDAATHRPSPYSRFVYVDLVNRRDSVLKKVKLALIDSVFAGYLKVPEDIRQGEYFLRSYSYWMQNLGEDYIYEKRIHLINPSDSKVLTGVTYQEEQGEKYAVVRLSNSRKEPYRKLAVDYQLIGKGKEGKVHRRRTDESGKVRINIGELADPSDVRIRFSNGIPYEFSRTIHLPADTLDYAVSFFPEGGEFIPGTRQTVAFKAIGKDGLSVDVEGYLYDERDSIVDIVRSIHHGMGWLNSPLESGKTYYVKVKSAQGLEKKFFLPEENRSGIALSIRQNGRELSYRVIGGEQAVLPDSLYLIAHTRGQLLVCTPLEGKLHGKLSAVNFPEGILHLCLMDYRCRIYSQRLCFIRHPEKTDLRIGTDRDGYMSREAVDVELILSSDSLREGRFSLSVTDDAAVLRDSLQDNIVSELLLNSDLKGYIEDPGFYFREVNRATDRCLDLLLLTQGWTRFDVGAVAAGEFEQLDYYMERGQTISGRVKNFWGKEAKDAQLTLLSTNMQFDVLQADSTGHFLVERISFPENTGFIVQARNSKGRKGVEVIIDSEVYLAPEIQIPYERRQANGEDEFYKQFGRDFYYDHGVKVYVLDEALVRRTPPKKNYSFYDASARYMLDSARLAAMKQKDMRTALMEIPGVMVIGEEITYRGKKLYLVLNDFPEEFDRIMMMNPEQFLSISLLDERMSYFYFGQEAPDGALIFTENFDYRPERLKQRGLSVFRPLGYQKPVDFYIPRYDVDSVRLAMADSTDIRPTVYWNPNIKLKTSEPTHVRFFMDDACDHCTFVLEGVLNDGTVCRKEKKISLRR